MTRTIPYDPSRGALYKPGLAADFFSGGRPATEAALCAEMARLAYCRDAGIRHAALARAGFAPLGEPFDQEGNFAFLAAGEEATVLAFRGTEGDDPRDLVADALLKLEPWPAGGRVHHGFARALERVWGRLGPVLAETPGRLLFTGHSLGAALATLAASRHPPALLCTFGSPRVGDARFVDAWDEAIEVSRFVNCCDLVTRVPPSPYRHLGRLCYIDRRGVVAADPSAVVRRADRRAARLAYLWRYAWRFGSVLSRDLADHAPVNYVAALRG